MLQVLVDADNVQPRRLQPVLDLLSAVEGGMTLTASGRRQALDRLDWPARSTLLPHTGWQRADLALAGAYRLDADPLLLVSGDGDFGLLATRHPGAVLVVSGAASNRLRGGTTVVDPAAEGVHPLRTWLAQNGVRLMEAGVEPAQTGVEPVQTGVEPVQNGSKPVQNLGEPRQDGV